MAEKDYAFSYKISRINRSPAGRIERANDQINGGYLS
ncbi:hypothetical protein PVAP13_4NG182700 [Panicum virgatum]|uniref:Uncharacterized protein n=1 Tax=Panicum virgatum TaxID=38727 RepID=A0A8T0TGT4_PANVG|nr:hypothetical protein PVAP13_4NG182700 [Panicum virgatum]